jgi:hypothetical protein
MMSKSAFPIRTFVVLGVITLLALVLAAPTGALAPHLQTTPEPGTRPPPTAAPFIEVDPTQAVGMQDVPIVVTGFLWSTTGPGITLCFDQFDNAHRLVGPVKVVQSDGSFELPTTIPAAWASPGAHTIIATDNQGFFADATIVLIGPTATYTPTPTNTPTNTSTPTPKTPTPTHTATLTPSPSPTLMPITPMTTITPIPVATKPPSAATNTPVRTATNTPIPGTATYTPTPSNTPTVTNTPGPGTPSVTPKPTSAPTLTSTPEQEISETGGGWGPVFLWGFVLAGLVVVFRVLRVRNLREPR